MLIIRRKKKQYVNLREWNWITEIIWTSTRRPVFRVSDHARLKPTYSVTEISSVECWNIACSKFIIYTFLGANNKGADQTAQMCRPVCAFDVSMQLLRHKAGQEGRGEILLENSFMRWRCYQGKIMHTTSKNFSVLYVLRKHQQHINIQWHLLRCYFWLIDHPILEQVATPRSFQLELILDCPVLDVRQLVRNKRRKEYD